MFKYVESVNYMTLIIQWSSPARCTFTLLDMIAGPTLNSLERPLYFIAFMTLYSTFTLQFHDSFTILG